ncbi:MAG: hypothetical protein V1875_04090 [Candidatus Altiarchaeota archaeon]
MDKGMLPPNVFFIEIDMKTYGWGLDIRPLLISEKGLHIGRWHNHYGMRDYLRDPLVWQALLTLRPGILFKPGLSAELWAEEYDQLDSGQYDEIRFEDIRGFSIVKHPFGQESVEILYRRGFDMGNIRFSVANQYSRLSGETNRLHSLIKEKLAFIRV